MDQSLDEAVAEFDEQAKVADGGDDGVERVPFAGQELLVEIFQLLQLDRFLFRLGGGALGARDVVGHFCQVGQGRDVALRQCPVDDQVGVAADWRGEMGVELLRQPVMPDRLGRVPGLLQRAQQPEMDRVFLRFAVHRGEQFLELAAVGEVADFVAEALRVLAEVFQLVEVGILMNPVETGNLRLAQMPGDGFVGDEHEFLDELVRDVIFNLLDAQRLAGFLVQADLDLREVQVEGTVGKPLFPQLGGEPPHLFQFAGQFVVAVLAAQPGEGLRIGQPVPGVDDAGAELDVPDGELRRELDQAALRQPVFPGPQAAQAVG